ncbi:hypothetical protein RRG08_056758 [Elysia crispata]|uniref:Uncharacterized protein n=1 Tax=Elysia crispata TaxID=231223 RepID=A0AAE1DKN4_9GAST|nr:hypothetical protein RRG08_056758 [Elysia crispata]
MADTNIFSSVTQAANGQASPAFGKETPAIVTQSPQPSTSTTQEIETDDMYSFRRRLQEQGFSGTATDVIMASMETRYEKGLLCLH